MSDLILTVHGKCFFEAFFQLQTNVNNNARRTSHVCMRYTIQSCRTVLFKECSAHIILYYFISLTVRTKTTVDVCLFMHAVLFYVCEMGAQHRHFTVLLVPFGMKNSKGDQRPGSANEQQKCRYVFLCPAVN